MKLLQVEHFRFEQDFMEDNIRCIPMIVRFKLDASCIKMKLREWNKLSVDEREQLAELPTDSTVDLEFYKSHLKKLIFDHTGENATELPVQNVNNSWSQTESIPTELKKKLDESNMNISVTQWKNLNVLQRFALLKLTRPGHENKNFPKAMKEFGLA